MPAGRVTLQIVGADGRVLWECPFADLPSDVAEPLRQELLTEANFRWACDAHARTQQEEEAS